MFAANSNQDVITNGFQSGTDKIRFASFLIHRCDRADDLAGHCRSHRRQYAATNQRHDGYVAVKGVAALNANDFILHA